MNTTLKAPALKTKKQRAAYRDQITNRLQWIADNRTGNTHYDRLVTFYRAELERIGFRYE